MRKSPDRFPLRHRDADGAAQRREAVVCYLLFPVIHLPFETGQLQWVRHKSRWSKYWARSFRTLAPLAGWSASANGPHRVLNVLGRLGDPLPELLPVHRSDERFSFSVINDGIEG